MLNQDDVIYFILTDRFHDGDPSNNIDVDTQNPFAYHGGDFAGIIKKIPYLKNLGITALWITPVYVNCAIDENGTMKMGYHGYWPRDFENVDPHLYTKKEGVADSKEYLKELVDELHANGIKVILDMVVNHAGYGHPGCCDGCGDTTIKPYWFNKKGLTSDEERYLDGLPDFDLDNPEVVDYMINVIADWIEKTGIDCIRMDTVKHVERAFWYHYKTYIKGKFGGISLLGEVLERDIERVSDFQKHFAFDYLFDFPLQNAVQNVFVYDQSPTLFAARRMSPNEELGILDQDTHYTNHNRLVTLLDNHDLPARLITSAIERFDGNRNYAYRVYKLALSFLFTTRGVPQLFYGDEIGLEGGKDPDNRKDMPWHLFDADGAPSEEHPIARDTFMHAKNLIRIRRENECLTFGSLTTLFVDNFLYVYLREFRGNAVIVAINNGHLPMETPLRIEFGQHTGIPDRVKRLLEGRSLIDIADGELAQGEVRDFGFDIRVEGKSAVILKPV